MATLYVRNMPDDLYALLRTRAHASGRSISAEVVMLLDQAVHAERFRRRQAAILRDINRRRLRQPLGPPFVVEALREDRSR